jgi:hypothetical protein
VERGGGGGLLNNNWRSRRADHGIAANGSHIFHGAVLSKASSWEQKAYDNFGTKTEEEVEKAKKLAKRNLMRAIALKSTKRAMVNGETYVLGVDDETHIYSRLNERSLPTDTRLFVGGLSFETKSNAQVMLPTGWLALLLPYDDEKAKEHHRGRHRGGLRGGLRGCLCGRLCGRLCRRRGRY